MNFNWSIKNKIPEYVFCNSMNLMTNLDISQAFSDFNLRLSSTLCGRYNKLHVINIYRTYIELSSLQILMHLLKSMSSIRKSSISDISIEYRVTLSKPPKIENFRLTAGDVIYMAGFKANSENIGKFRIFEKFLGHHKLCLQTKLALNPAYALLKYWGWRFLYYWYV